MPEILDRLPGAVLVRRSPQTSGYGIDPAQGSQS